MSGLAAFLGLGTMGLPMATHLLEAGVPLSVYNRSTGRAALPVASVALEYFSPRPRGGSARRTLHTAVVHVFRNP